MSVRSCAFLYMGAQRQVQAMTPFQVCLSLMVVFSRSMLIDLWPSDFSLLLVLALKIWPCLGLEVLPVILLPHVCACAYRGQGSTSGAIPQELLTLYSQTGSFPVSGLGECVSPIRSVGQ